MAAKKKARRKSAKGKKTGTRKPRTPKVESTETAPGVSTEGSPKQDGRARYTEEFKKAAVSRTLGNETATAVAKDLGVSVMSLRQWRRKFGGEGAGSPETANAAPKRRGRPPKRLGEPPKRLGRPPKASAAPKPTTGGIAGSLQAKLRQIDELKAEIRDLARQL